MNERTPKSVAIYIRVTPALKQAFEKEAARYGLPSEVLRELIQAFVEGRVTISPPSNVKESLYNVTRKID